MHFRERVIALHDDAVFEGRSDADAARGAIVEAATQFDRQRAQRDP